MPNFGETRDSVPQWLRRMWATKLSFDRNPLQNLAKLAILS